MSLKFELIHRVGDYSFNHSWKDIMINQLNMPDHPGICFEKRLVDSKHYHAYDFLDCYWDLKNRAAEATGKCINHCVWQNSLITDIGYQS